MTFAMTELFRPGLPPPADPGATTPRFSFVGGNNDSDMVPFGALAEAAVAVLRREGNSLASYNVGGSALGYLPLRNFVVDKLGARAALRCTPDQILITSGSLQALDLVNNLLLTAGDTVIIEQGTYGGMVSRLKALGVNYVGAPLDRDGIDTDQLATILDDLANQGITPKYIYTIPTVQNPTGSVMSRQRRLALLELSRSHGIAIFEDDCYADLCWGTERPPSIRALDGDGGQVIYCGSFSKSVAPALRVGYLVADAAVIAQLLALKTDAGTGALEQMVLAEFAPTHFDDHVERLTSVLKTKAEIMMDAVRQSFGPTVTFEPPMGGIFLWLTFPDGTDTAALTAVATAAGIEFNAGAGWSSDPTYGSRRMRLCFGHPTHETIREGVAALGEIYHASH